MPNTQDGIDYFVCLAGCPFPGCCNVATRTLIPSHPVLGETGGGTNTGWTLSDKAVKSYKKYMYWFINNKKWTFRYRNESFKDRFWFFVCSGCYQPLKLFLTVCGYRTTWRIHWVHISSNMKTKHDTSEHVKSVQIEKKI